MRRNDRNATLLLFFGAMIRRHVRLGKWLKANGMPPPLLPMVCGYAPLASDVLKALKGGWGDEKQPPLPKPPTTVVAGGDGKRASAAGPAPRDETAVAPAAPSKGSKAKVASAGASRAARNPGIVDDVDSPVR